MIGWKKADDVISKLLREVGGPVAEMPPMKAAEAATPEEVTKVTEKTGNLVIDVLFDAIAERRFASIRYETPQKDGSGRLRTRDLLPSHLYTTKDGNVCVVGYDSYHEEVRTFRVDRIQEIALAGFAPKPDLNGKTAVFPGTYRLRFAKPQVVKNAESYLAKGWVEKPIPQILVPDQA
jgi:predicted DNA-binding transcriptional regulator YafY